MTAISLCPKSKHNTEKYNTDQTLEHFIITLFFHSSDAQGCFSANCVTTVYPLEGWAMTRDITVILNALTSHSHNNISWTMRVHTCSIAPTQGVSSVPQLQQRVFGNFCVFCLIWTQIVLQCLRFPKSFTPFLCWALFFRGHTFFVCKTRTRKSTSNLSISRYSALASAQTLTDWLWTPVCWN